MALGEKGRRAVAPALGKLDRRAGRADAEATLAGRCLQSVLHRLTARPPRRVMLDITLLRKDLAVGAEYRAKPNQLAFAGAPFEEGAWKDLFIAWAPSKRVSVTAAWVDLGNIVGHARQTGAYLSLQLAH